MTIENNDSAANGNTGGAGAESAEQEVSQPTEQVVDTTEVTTSGGIASGGTQESTPAETTAGNETAVAGEGESEAGREADFTVTGGIASGSTSKNGETEEGDEGESDTDSDADSNSGIESYKGFEDELEKPENFEFDPELVDEFKEMAAETGMSREDVKKYGQYGVKMTEKITQNMWKAHFDQKQRWEKETLGSPEFKGTQGASNIGLVEQTFASVFSKETQKMLAQSGLDSHPGFCKDLLAIGKSNREDQVVRGGIVKQSKSTARAYVDDVGFTPVT